LRCRCSTRTWNRICHRITGQVRFTRQWVAVHSVRRFRAQGWAGYADYFAGVPGEAWTSVEPESWSMRV
jgi:hypothetical protein